MIEPQNVCPNKDFRQTDLLKTPTSKHRKITSTFRSDVRENSERYLYYLASVRLRLTGFDETKLILATIGIYFWVFKFI